MTFETGKTQDGEEAVHPKSAMYCHVRFCPVCQYQKGKKKRRTFMDMLPTIEVNHPDYVWLFLTIALKNVKPEEVREEFQQLNQSFSRATKRKKWPAEGWIVTRELTRGRDGSAHPHLHVMLLVPQSYFEDGYLSHQDWLQFVRETFRIDYDPAVRIQRIGAANQNSEEAMRKAVLEVFKYTVKSQDLLEDPSWTHEITNQMHQLRAQTVGGLLRKYLKNLEDDTVDDIEIEHWFVPDEEEGLIVLQWSPWKKEYLVREISRPDLNRFIDHGMALAPGYT